MTKARMIQLLVVLAIFAAFIAQMRPMGLGDGGGLTFG